VGDGFTLADIFTKSKYLSGLQCHKRLWVEVNDSNRIPAIPRSQQRIIDQGIEVGVYARHQFSEGVLIDGNHSEALKTTEEALQNNAACIFEAAFQFDTIFVRCDIVQNVGPGLWDLIEVKASTKIKDEHYYDLAIQKYVVLGQGININSVKLMFINNQDCFYPELSNLFKIEDVTAQVDQVIEEIPQVVQDYRLVLAGPEPVISIGEHCTKPNPCSLKDFCWQYIPEHSIFTIPRLSNDKKNELVKQEIFSIFDLPSDYSLTAKQREYINSVSRAAAVIDHEGIRAELSKLVYPLYFFDFETNSAAIPKFDGLKPYSHFPFQYSCHVKQSDGSLTHYEYLHPEQSDPRLSLVESLISHISNTGSVIVYYAAFERSILNELAKAFPQYAIQLQSIVFRLWDQLEIFKNYYNHPGFGGSNSIKKVLPILVPSLSYGDLRVQKGDEAQAVWELMINTTDAVEKSHFSEELKAYCKMDTYAMVEIHKVLESTKLF